MGTSEQLLAVSPLDGRDRRSVEGLGEMVSEYGLMKYRVVVETRWLSLLNSGVLPDVTPLGGRAHRKLRAISDGFSHADAERIKEIEKTTNHDVKALELWLREQLCETPVLSSRAELTHFGLTSEDPTNLAYAMMMRDARDEVLLPNIRQIGGNFEAKAHSLADFAMLAHTHGQPASPTTLGKEMAVFAERLDESARCLGGIAIKGKLNGASGNYSALTIAYPEVDWPAVSQDFVEDLGFEFNSTTTQIEPHDWMVRYFNELALANNIMTDSARDIWLYIMLNYFKLKVIEGETGSSTMPHKVNPIDFEKAWSNFGSANVVLSGLADRLPISQLQRDLSDSSTQRTTGEALGHTLVGQRSMIRGLEKIIPNEEAINRDLNKNWAVLTEAVQTVMRRYGIEGAYDIIKAASRGRDITEADYLKLAGSIEGIPAELRARLLNLTPATYTGRAAEIAREAV